MANYIITQSPMKETIPDLWRLVNDYNCKIIVMLENAEVSISLHFNKKLLSFSHKKKYKQQNYFP